MNPAALAPLASHLWQSTLFAAAAGLLTLALRRNQARVRYWLWLAASYKFLLPFSWLVSIGHQFEWRAAPATMPRAFSAVTDVVSGPIFVAALPAGKPSPDHLSALLFAIWAVWACGFVVVAGGWVREWLRLRAIVRAASPLFLGLPIRVISTPARLEPGVVGLFRPVLLLPEGIAARLTQAQMQAVLAHELCHVRRRDNLAAAVHMLVEALFWFHPLVWWLGVRLIDERERACDEEVLQAGNQAQVYAESILKVCELYLESPLTCVSGVTGSDLKERIRRIMKRHFGLALSVRKKLLLTAAGVAALAVPIGVGVLTAPRLLGAQAAAAADWQTAAGGKLAFDVASVKPNKEAARPISNIPLTLDDTYAPTGGLFSATDNTLRAFMWFAYKTQQVPVGFPDWGSKDRFDIEARAQGNPTKDQYRLMMQSLLADRFKLAAHFESRQIPVYALTLSKGGKTGPQLKPEDGSCAPITPADIQARNAANAAAPLSPPSTSGPQPPIPCGTLAPVPPSTPGRMRIAGRKVTMALLVRMMTNPASGVDRPVLDQTGLSGNFDVSIEWTPAIAPPPGSGFTPDQEGPTFFEAMQDQLGLKLQAQTGPVDVLVIDHIERPSENSAAIAAGSAPAAPLPSAQSASADDKLKFDAASIKPSKPDNQGANLGNLALPGGLYRATNAPLRALIAAMYFRDFNKRRLIFGGPDWIDSERFDIEARVDGNPGREEKRLMVRSLLEDRFKLVLHHETRQLPIYTLVLAKPGKRGPQLIPHSGDAKCTDNATGKPLQQPGPGEAMPAYCGGFFMSARPGDLRATGNEITMDMLAPFLSQSVDRTVVDGTGLSGVFDFTLEFAPELGPGSQLGTTASASDQSTAPSIFTALQEQLGLKLESQKGPVDVLVIDHIEQPSEN